MYKPVTYILLLVHNCFVETGLEHFHHLLVLKVVYNVLENITVADESKGTENNHNGDICFDIGDCGSDSLSVNRLVLGSTAKQLHQHWSCGAWRVFQHRADFSHKKVLGFLALEYIDVVRGHALLCDNDLLSSVDDKVATSVQWTLLEAVHVTGRNISFAEDAVIGAQHDRNATNVDLLDNICCCRAVRFRA